ncbi:MAG TPA: dihydrolipoamide acetyltransferase family protein, partial [Spirochaetia bacterium]
GTGGVLPPSSEGVTTMVVAEEGVAARAAAPSAVASSPAASVTAHGPTTAEGGATLGRATASAAVRAPSNGNGAAVRTKLRASPVARKVAADAGIDLTAVTGTGPGGRILKKDVETARSAPRAASAAPAVNTVGEVRKLSTLRTAIAVAMEKSQAIPAAAVHDYTLVDELLQLRRDINANMKERVGLLAFFVKAAAMALRDYPLLSSTYSPERREYQTFASPNIGVAVDTDEGLVVPVVKGAAELSVQRIHAEIVRLTEKAKTRTLLLEEIRSGSFTISNFGSFSGIFGNPMILPPQVGILGIGRIHEEPVVKDHAVVPASILPLSLVVDHRLIDGVYACKFLSRFMELVSKPLLLLMP